MITSFAFDSYEDQPFIIVHIHIHHHHDNASALGNPSRHITVVKYGFDYLAVLVTKG